MPRCQATTKAGNRCKRPAKTGSKFCPHHQESIQEEVAWKKEIFLEALQKSMGIVKGAVDKTGFSRSTHFHWMRTDQEYKEKVREIEEDAKDFAESQLLVRIREGDGPRITYFLDNKAQDRGYGKQLHRFQPQNAQEEEDYSHLTDEELEKKLKEEEKKLKEGRKNRKVRKMGNG